MKTVFCSLVAIAACLVSLPAQAQDKWFDMENCAICKNIAEHQEIMMDTKWDVYPISTGMVMVAVVPEKHKAVMEAVHKDMMETVAKLEQGEPMELCQFCKTYGGLKQAGCQIEEVETVGGQLTVVTSDDEKLVERIHQFAKRSHDEHQKMMKAMAGKK